MPIYDYLCRNCGHTFEGLVLKGSEPPSCPSCDEEDLERLLSMPSVHSEARKQRSMRAARKRDSVQAKEREYTQRQYELNHDD